MPRLNQKGCPTPFLHPKLSRRVAIQAGAVGLLGLGTNHLTALQSLAATGEVAQAAPRARAVIYIFLSGGLGQQDSFDLKPEAPEEIRGEFKPIATRTPGIEICEHLPMLASRSQHWSLLRSLTHSSNDHSAGHLIMLTGRTQLPPGFDPTKPNPTDWPSIAAIAGALTKPRNNLPPAVILPEKLVHNSGRVIPGQLAGVMGPSRDPMLIEASPFDPNAYGAYPEYEFDHQERKRTPTVKRFQAPNLSLPEGFGATRFSHRLELLDHLDAQRRELDENAQTVQLDRHRQDAISMLTDPRVKQAFDVMSADPKMLERYGRNSFGWSLLMARRLVEAGVNLVQVNLGNNETWDTHGNAFPHLRNNLFPPTDRALSALLDDLHSSGLLDSTLIVMAGEFGRTPRISTLPNFYKSSGRDHWGHVQTVFFAGGGTQGGRVVGSTDKNAGYPTSNPQTPEALAATIYRSLGIPQSTHWTDAQSRPHYIYYGEPIAGLF
ncbi:DUF1501 domain-containing protein [Singulisphaera acidiphila]|uniref:DUF1501 domain-containing protein n=1 Tax=Singulisphaera acidiphila (strain ATCC BAA-1392 / DSM 18658 / VKM B-2454 / MOB10) TaxID=886293 RepID=L0DN53_SINAD|nr:DUF1501 domain-containing protein [Singulisphaera acidiphila]AGA30101.1 hypothetical protein Sinac_5990 [Singulisphaera acidiphila DSM 18658]